MLKTSTVYHVQVKEFRCRFVRVYVLFLDLETYSIRIIVAFFDVCDRYRKYLDRRVLRRERLAAGCSKCRYTAMSGEIVTYKRYFFNIVGRGALFIFSFIHVKRLSGERKFDSLSFKLFLDGKINLLLDIHILIVISADDIIYDLEY